MLDLLPPGQRTKVLTLMGFNPTSAGGLMGVDFLALRRRRRPCADALAAVAGAESLQPEALTSVHAVDASRRLRGVVTVVRLLQADPDARLIDGLDTDPVRVGADTDVVDVAVLMSDYNLITVPVVDEEPPDDRPDHRGRRARGHAAGGLAAPGDRPAAGRAPRKPAVTGRPGERLPAGAAGRAPPPPARRRLRPGPASPAG